MSVAEIKTHIEDLSFDYDRMSSSGQQTLDKIAGILGLPTENEVTEMMETVKNG